jgi:hypothetical protein
MRLIRTVFDFLLQLASCNRGQVQVMENDILARPIWEVFDNSDCESRISDCIRRSASISAR